MKEIVSVGLWVLLAVPVSAVELVVVDGALMGANEVEVNSALYDVRFLDGTCIELFAGCDELSDLTFTSLGSVTAATLALQNQVLVDGPSGAFGTDPELTNGCSDTQHCQVLTPFGIPDSTGVDVYEANNWSPPISSPNYVVTLNNFSSTANRADGVFARWQPSSSAVPMLSTPAAMLMVGLMIATGFSRVRMQGTRAGG